MTSLTIPDPTPTIEPHLNPKPLVSMPVTPSSLVFQHTSTKKLSSLSVISLSTMYKEDPH